LKQLEDCNLGLIELVVEELIEAELLTPSNCHFVGLVLTILTLASIPGNKTGVTAGHVR
jgi:hypothetical protein